MTRVHDMGGRPCADRIAHPEPYRPVFKEEWHGRALALTLAAGALGKWNLDASRHARETLPPDEYLSFSYYERWLAALADLLVRHGLVTGKELSEPEACRAAPDLVPGALKPGEVLPILQKGSRALRETDAVPRFRVGEDVRTRYPAANALVGNGHTRLPAYAQGRHGTVRRIHGAHVLPDSNAHFLGEAPEPLYSVGFPASELFPNEGLARSGDEVFLDLWESYLEPA